MSMVVAKRDCPEPHAPERPIAVDAAGVGAVEPGPDAAPANWNGIVQGVTSEV